MLLRLFNKATVFYLRLLGAQRSSLRVGAVNLVYYRLGPEDGEPWALLHGLGSVAATWGPVLSALRRECRLIVPELSALGGTETPSGGLAVREGSGAVARLIEEEFGVRPVSVAGISLGGWMAVRLALDRPELVARLALIDAGGYRDQDWDRIQEMVTVNDLAGVDRLYTALFARTPWMMRLSRQGFLQAYTSRAVKGILQELSDDDAFDDDTLRRLHLPVALIWGDRDGLFTLETARSMAAALPQAHLEVLPNCGHAVHMEHPRLLVRALQGFRSRTAGLESPETPWSGGPPCPARNT
jgi:pimeloyl-ACP methyl ester carboxylesterase